MAEGEGFFSRWSRQKIDARATPVAAPVEEALPAPVIVPEPVAPAEPAPTLDDVAQLAPGDDVARFVRAGVEPDVQRAALKKLFADPHFNVMDGLDVYIDDYSKPDPIPESMLRQMVQSKFLGLFADEEEQATDIPRSQAAVEPDPGPATPPDEDPDLQLQRDDSARPDGPVESA